MYAVFMDLVKAYDKVCREELWECLQKYGVRSSTESHTLFYTIVMNVCLCLGVILTTTNTDDNRKRELSGECGVCEGRWCDVRLD